MSASEGKLSLKELIDIVTKELVEVSTGSFFIRIENDDGGSCICIYAEPMSEKEQEAIIEMRLNMHEKFLGRRFILYFCDKEYIDVFVKSKKQN